MSAHDEPKMTVDLEADGVVSSHCEACGLRYYIMPNEGYVVHELPMCPDFQTSDPLDYVARNRIKKRDRAAGRMGQA